MEVTPRGSRADPPLPIEQTPSPDSVEPGGDITLAERLRLRRESAEQQRAEILEERSRAEQGFNVEQRLFLDTARERRQVGYLLGCLGILVISSLGIVALVGLHTWMKVPLDQREERFQLTVAIGHGVVSMGLALFAYQLLKAAERMVLPYWWVERHPEVAKVMLGIHDPITASTRLIEKLAGAAEKVARTTKR